MIYLLKSIVINLESIYIDRIKKPNYAWLFGVDAQLIEIKLCQGLLYISITLTCLFMMKSKLIVIIIQLLNPGRLEHFHTPNHLQIRIVCGNQFLHSSRRNQLS